MWFGAQKCLGLRKEGAVLCGHPPGKQDEGPFPWRGLRNMGVASNGQRFQIGKPTLPQRQRSKTYRTTATFGYSPRRIMSNTSRTRYKVRPSTVPVPVILPRAPHFRIRSVENGFPRNHGRIRDNCAAVPTM